MHDSRGMARSFSHESHHEQTLDACQRGWILNRHECVVCASLIVESTYANLMKRKFERINMLASNNNLPPRSTPVVVGCDGFVVVVERVEGEVVVLGTINVGRGDDMPPCEICSTYSVVIIFFSIQFGYSHLRTQILTL